MNIKSILFCVVFITLVSVSIYYLRGTNQIASCEQQLENGSVGLERSAPSIISNTDVTSCEQINVPCTSKKVSNQIYTIKSDFEQKKETKEWFGNNITNSENQVENSYQQSKKVAKNLMDPYEVLDNELAEIQRYYKDQELKLKHRYLTDTQYANEIYKLQAEYDSKKHQILLVKQNLDMVQKLVNEGSITPEAGKEAMWRFVLPQETEDAMFPSQGKAKK